MHTEPQPHTFGVAWTTSRTTDPLATSLDNGGHFFLASHGIRIQSSPNSLLIWRPGILHGTSLPLQDPRGPSTLFCQRGLAFVTSSRLPEAWQLYEVDKQAASAEVLSTLFAHLTTKSIASTETLPSPRSSSPSRSHPSPSSFTTLPPPPSLPGDAKPVSSVKTSVKTITKNVD